MKIGDKIGLFAKSNKGKQRLQRDGFNNWEILAIESKVLFSTETGPWIRIGKQNHKNIGRWIHTINDDNFGIKTN